MSTGLTKKYFGDQFEIIDGKITLTDLLTFLQSLTIDSGTSGASPLAVNVNGDPFFRIDNNGRARFGGQIQIAPNSVQVGDEFGGSVWIDAPIEWDDPSGSTVLYGLAIHITKTQASDDSYIASFELDNGTQFQVGTAMTHVEAADPDNGALVADNLTSGKSIFGAFSNSSKVFEINSIGVVIPASGIKGKSSTGNATSGNVGEYVESKITISSATSLTNATAKNITSISLTAGDWEVSANVNFIGTGTTTTELVFGTLGTSATLPTDGSEIYCGTPTTTSTYKTGGATGTNRFSLASTTIIYLVVKATFSAGTMTAFGTLKAWRGQPGS